MLSAGYKLRKEMKSESALSSSVLEVSDAVTRMEEPGHNCSMIKQNSIQHFLGFNHLSHASTFPMRLLCTTDVPTEFN